MDFLKKLSLCALFVLPLTAVNAQQTNANIAYVFPAGGQAGTTFKAILGGRNFADAESVVVTGGGVSVKIGEVTIPANQNDVPGLRNRLEKEYIVAHPEIKEEIEKLGKDGDNFLRKKIMENPENVKALAEMSASYYLRQLSSDALAETIEVEITIDDDAEISERNIMVLTPNGLSNAVKFMVGALPEVAEESLRAVARDRSSYEKNKGRWLHVYTQILPYVEPSKKTVVDVKLPVVANGQITEATTDSYRFEAKKGQKIVLSVQAQSLIPYISDAVPGWFQTVIVVRDSQNREVAYNDDFYHHPDSLLLFDVPEDGAYTVEIFDAIFRSREDFVYRLTIGEIPFVTSLFPLGGKTGSIDNFEINGFNLDAATTQVNLDKAGVSARPTELALKSIAHLNLPLMVSGVNEVLSAAEIERMRNGGETFDPAKLPAVELTIPLFANGRIVQKNQFDTYKINLDKGAGAVVEIFARRLNSPLDAYITISDESGKILARSDDVEDLSYGLVTHHADPRLQFTAPEKGSYYIKVFDSSGAASAEHSYRLYIGEPSGDFELRTVPANINIAPADSTVFTVHAFRKNGFSGPINLSVKNLPKGWNLSGGYMGAEDKSVRLTLTAPADAERQIFPIQLYGSAVIGPRTVTHASIPCEDMMQAFYYKHLVPAEQQNVCVNTSKNFGKRYNSLKFETDYIDKTIVIPIEGKKVIKLGKLSKKAESGIKCNIESSGDNLKAVSFYVSNDTMFAVLEADTEKSKIGETGRFVLTLIARKGRDYLPIGSLPSWEYRIGQKISAADKSASEQAAALAEKQAKEAASKEAAAKKAAKKEKKAAKKNAAADAAKTATDAKETPQKDSKNAKAKDSKA